MKITICAKRFGGPGGQEHFISLLARFLAEQNHRVKILAVRGHPMPGLELETVRVPHGVPRACRDWIYGRALARRMETDTADVSFGEQKTWNCNVIRPGGGVEVDYWQRRIRESGLPPMIGAARAALSAKRFFDLRCERNSYAASSLQHVVVNSNMVRDELQANYPHVGDRVTVIRNGADVERFSPNNAEKWRGPIREQLHIEEQSLTGIFAAHNFKLKGLREAIEAMALAAQQRPTDSLRLIVLGGGDAAEYRHLATRLNVANAVAFVGSTLHPEEYYAAADFLLFPTYYDPCANVTLEALASGLPVITTRLNGAHELLTDGTNGWAVPHPSDTSAMAKMILHLGSNEALAPMKAAARQLALQHRLETKLTEVERILRDAARRRNTAAS